MNKLLPKRLMCSVIIVRPGAWDHAGLVAMTYDDDISGEFEVISRGHLYNWCRGIDIYPSREQFTSLCAGEQVKGVRWA